MDILATLQVYTELADWYERQGQAAMRDRFLILAAEAAFSAGKPEEAERLRQRLLQGNPHHMLKPFTRSRRRCNPRIFRFTFTICRSTIRLRRRRICCANLHSGIPPAPPASASGANTLGPLPQTAPLIEIRDEPTLPLAGATEPLKVYSLREEPERANPSKPPVKPTHLNRPAERKPLPPPLERPPTLKAPAPRSQAALPRSPRPVPVTPPTTSESAAPAGAWLTLLLFGMTVTAGVALAVYTLARPFLPLP